jgi:hypothetical protein
MHISKSHGSIARLVMTKELGRQPFWLDTYGWSFNNMGGSTKALATLGILEVVQLRISNHFAHPPCRYRSFTSRCHKYAGALASLAQVLNLISSPTNPIVPGQAFKYALQSNSN